ncbi:helix-turn-helix transcriptional regulator [Tardiphaga sp. 42S5]|uniref:helix-turn-helix transcriptional regulator n=1 Tax=Tardiphaga sp. 42S5 TaxID=1404799 RepID=UPI002A5A3F1A|nr:helix-turn-helix transcriptional regulator [Tardiphaga sp. 42S5]WPO43397.1 helix-turn-helix transcriptional regulator [Tardiphaga sp. 42S5]
MPKYAVVGLGGMDPFDLERITGALASAALDQWRWSEAAETVAKCTGSYGAVLLPVVGPLPFVAATPSMEKSFEVYSAGGWLDRDERYLGTSTFLREGVATDDDCLPAELRKRSSFYQDFLARCGLSEFAGVRVGRGDRIWNLSIQRTPQQGAFSRNELSWLAQLSQRLDSIAEISCALEFSRGEAALDAFQFSDRAALLLDRAGNVVHTNSAADDLIGPDLAISGRRVRSFDRRATERLEQSIRALLWTGVASVVPPIVFPKVSDGNLIIYPMRLRGLTASPLSAFHAILVIVDTQAQRSPLATTLRILFGLTPAEARLATAVANGIDLATFAIGANVSKDTVRNQLKAVFEKTGARRQPELAVLLTTLLPKK